MRLYDIGLFIHVVAAIAVFASLTMDWLAVIGLRRATTTHDARTWVGVLETSGAIGPLARIAVLLAGLYLAFTGWSWEGWIIVGLVAWLVLVVLGEPLTGSDLREMRSNANAAQGPLAGPLRNAAHDPKLWRSVVTRIGLGIAIVALMTTKPPLIAAAGIVIAGCGAGFAAAQLISPRERAREPRRSL